MDGFQTASVDPVEGWTTVSLYTIWALSLVGALAYALFLSKFVPRMRVAVFEKPLKACVLSVDDSDKTLRDLMLAKLGDLGTTVLNTSDKSPEKVFVIVGRDVEASTLLIRQALEANLKNDVVIVDVISHHVRSLDVVMASEEERQLASEETTEETVFELLCERGRHRYYKRLTEGLEAEYLHGRVRLATVDVHVAKEQGAVDELLEFMQCTGSNARMRLTRAELMRPKVYQLHMGLIFAACVLYIVFSSPAVSMMDPNTLKPRQGFDPRLKSLARATNIPIKLGIVHGILYMLEYFLDPEMFKRHVGQRLTTLWYQIFQFARFGQHLQMHIETLVQCADALCSARLYKRTYIRAFLWIVIAGVLTQNALTSLAYHSFTEQTIGFCLCMLKLVCFDWAGRGARINRAVGQGLAEWFQWVGGMLSLGGGLFFNGFAPLHPTVMASLIFLGGTVALLIALRVRGGSVTMNRFFDP